MAVPALAGFRLLRLSLPSFVRRTTWKSPNTIVRRYSAIQTGNLHRKGSNTEGVSNAEFASIVSRANKAAEMGNTSLVEDIALEIPYNRMRQQQRNVLCNHILKAYNRAQKPLPRNVIDYLTVNGYKMTKKTVSKILEGLINFGNNIEDNMDEIIAWMDYAKASGNLDAVLCNQIMRAFSRIGKTQVVASLYEKMKRDGIPIQPHAEYTMVRTYLEADNLSKALEHASLELFGNPKTLGHLIREDNPRSYGPQSSVKKKDIQMRVKIAAILFEYIAKMARKQETEMLHLQNTLFIILKKIGLKFCSKCYSWNLLILCRLGKDDEATKVLEEALAVGVLPKSQGLSAISEARAKAGDYKFCQNLLDIRLRENEEKEEIAFTVGFLVKAYSHAGLLNSAENAISKYVGQKVIDKPDAYFMRGIMVDHCRQKQTEIVEFWIDYMKRNKIGVDDRLTRLTIFQTFLAMGLFPEAKEIFESITKEIKDLKTEEKKTDKIFPEAMSIYVEHAVPQKNRDMIVYILQTAIKFRFQLPLRWVVLALNTCRPPDEDLIDMLLKTKHISVKSLHGWTALLEYIAETERPERWKSSIPKSIFDVFTSRNEGISSLKVCCGGLTLCYYLARCGESRNLEKEISRLKDRKSGLEFMTMNHMNIWASDYINEVKTNKITRKTGFERACLRLRLIARARAYDVEGLRSLLDSLTVEDKKNLGNVEKRLITNLIPNDVV